MGFTDLMNELKEAFGDLSGDEITRVFNGVCDRQVEYRGDPVLRYQYGDR